MLNAGTPLFSEPIPPLLRAAMIALVHPRLSLPRLVVPPLAVDGFSSVGGSSFKETFPFPLDSAVSSRGRVTNSGQLAFRFFADPRKCLKNQRARRDSNPQPSDPKSKRDHHPAAPHSERKPSVVHDMDHRTPPVRLQSGCRPHATACSSASWPVC